MGMEYFIVEQEAYPNGTPLASCASGCGVYEEVENLINLL